MLIKNFSKTVIWTSRLGGAAALLFALSMPGAINAQDNRYRDYDHDRLVRLDPGTDIPVRLTQRIDVNQQDNRIYSAVVERDVPDADGRLAIPRGAAAELIVRVTPDNDLVLHLQSVTVDGQRYFVRTDRNRIESQPNTVGAIIGAITGNEARGQAVRLPRDSVLSFSLDRPLEIMMDRPDRRFDAGERR